MNCVDIAILRLHLSQIIISQHAFGPVIFSQCVCTCSKPDSEPAVIVCVLLCICVCQCVLSTLRGTQPSAAGESLLAGR